MRILLTNLALSWVMLHCLAAQVPEIINYQGRVAVDGVNFDGPGEFKFALVNAGTNKALTAAATANLTDGFVTSVTIANGGSGYTTVPAISFSGGGGSGAAATATLSVGRVVDIVVTNAGSGYTSAPTVVIESPPPNVVYTTYWSNDGSSSSGGEPSASVAATVTRGLYTVPLGDATRPNMTAIPLNVFENPDVHLRVWFDDGTNGPQLLTPDQRLAATGYAMMAGNVPDQAIVAEKIADGAVTGAKLSVGAVTAAKLAANSVTGAKIADGTITTQDLADNIVTNAKLADGSVGTTKLLDGSVSSTKLSAISVTSAKLANSAVTSTKLAADSVDGSKIVDGSIDSVDLADGAVTTAKLADGSVGASQLANSAVTSAKLSTGSITSAKLADGAVTSAKIAASSVGGAHLTGGSVTSTKLANDELSLGRITDGKLHKAGNNIGVGTSVPKARLHVGPSNEDFPAVWPRTGIVEHTNEVSLALRSSSYSSGVTHSLFFERPMFVRGARISMENGFFQIGDYTFTGPLSTEGGPWLHLDLANGRFGVARTPTSNRLEVNGSASKTTSGSWLANSDRRIKADIRDIRQAQDAVMNLRPVAFRYTDEWLERNPSIEDRDYLNFIAQEYREVFPHAVKGSGEFLENDTREILQIDTHDAQIVTIKAVQELIEENRALRAEMEELKQFVRSELEEIRAIARKAVVTRIEPEAEEAGPRVLSLPGL